MGRRHGAGRRDRLRHEPGARPGPRIAYQLLPIAAKTSNNWIYGLVVPGIAPFVGAIAAAAFTTFALGIAF
uniref:hypothetical protein n=1 Tax=Collinsella sp. BA40 TaxID=2560852 RepID=UPI002104B3B5|nr:hypothetical protein [Collinsella sp. BA40]